MEIADAHERMQNEMHASEYTQNVPGLLAKSELVLIPSAALKPKSVLTFHRTLASAPSRALKFETRHHPLAPPMFAMYRATQYTAQPLYVSRNMLS